MPDRTQDLTNHRKVAQASKNYTDQKAEEILWQLAENDVSTSDDNTTASTKTVPSNATRCKIKRIYGLTQKFNPSVASDSTSAMVKTMPSTVYDFDVSKVEGKSEVSENEIKLTNQPSGTQTGITYSIADGVIPLSGTATQNMTINLTSAVYFDGTYTFKNFGSQALSSSTYFVFLLNGEWTNPITIKTDVGTTISLSGNYIFGIAITGGTTVNGDIKPMLVKGSTTPTTFEPHYDGIHNFAWTGVKVEGENILNITDVAETTVNDITYKVINNEIYLNGTTNANTNIWLTIQEITCNGTYYFKDFQSGTLGTFARGLYKNNVAQQNLSVNAINMNNVNANQLLYYIPSGQTFTNAKLTPMLVLGSTAPTEFKPYVSQTISIDLSTILYNGSPLFEGNVLRENDYITPYKASKGRKNTTITNSSNIFSWDGYWYLEATNFNGFKALGTIKATKDYFNNRLESNGNLKTTLTTSYTATQVRELIVGAEIEYPLATPIEVSIDWSSTLRHITGYSNGTITLLNTNNQDTDNTITYNSIIKENCCAKIVQSRGGNVVKTINLPTQASDGYSAGSVANVRDLTTSKRIGNVTTYDLGNINYNKYEVVGLGTLFRGGIPNMKYDHTTNILCKKYNTVLDENRAEGTIYKTQAGTAQVDMIDSNYSTAETFKISLVNVPLYYELADASKTETSIDSVDNVIEVEPSDVLSFYDENDNLVTVPSDLTYRIEVAQ